MHEKLYDMLDKLRKPLFKPYCSFLSWVAGKAAGWQDVEKFAGCGLCLVTVTYNKPDLTRIQAGLVKRNVADTGYVRLILDNSSKRSSRAAIRQTCREAGIEYVPVPRFFHFFLLPHLFFYGISEGMALNWFCQKVLPVLRPERLAIIDHDIFPLRKYSFVSHLGGKPFYGVDRPRATGWYLWPGLAIFDCRQMRKWGFNFMPCFVKGAYFDTGGGNYETIFSHYDRQDEMFAAVKTERYAYGKDDAPLNIYHRDCVQIVDHAWLHLINGSNYAHLEKKERIISHIIDHLDDFTRKD